MGRNERKRKVEKKNKLKEKIKLTLELKKPRNRLFKAPLYI